MDFGVYHRTSCHDCAESVARERFERSRGQSNRPYRQPCSLAAQPDVPTRYLMCSEDRLMNNPYWRPVVRAQLGVRPVELPGSHSPMASRPEELALILAASVQAEH